MRWTLAQMSIAAGVVLAELMSGDSAGDSSSRQNSVAAAPSTTRRRSLMAPGAE